MKRNSVHSVFCFLVFGMTFVPVGLEGQSDVNRDTLLVAAREIMNETTYCALATVDSTGQPQVRTMNPFPPNDEFIIWFATSRTSRKVREIRNDPKVCVYYANHISAKGYVSITGTATIIDDKDILLSMKRDYWQGIPGWQDKFVLIKVIPRTIEVINYRHGLNNNPETFRAPSVTLQ
jgi:general stress protein 26